MHAAAPSIQHRKLASIPYKAGWEGQSLGPAIAQRVAWPSHLAGPRVSRDPIRARDWVRGSLTLAGHWGLSRAAITPPLRCEEKPEALLHLRRPKRSRYVLE
jgi:hypothetical protein